MQKLSLIQLSYQRTWPYLDWHHWNEWKGFFVFQFQLVVTQWKYLKGKKNFFSVWNFIWARNSAYEAQDAHVRQITNNYSSNMKMKGFMLLFSNMQWYSVRLQVAPKQAGTENLSRMENFCNWIVKITVGTLWLWLISSLITCVLSICRTKAAIIPLQV